MFVIFALEDYIIQKQKTVEAHFQHTRPVKRWSKAAPLRLDYTGPQHLKAAKLRSE